MPQEAASSTTTIRLAHFSDIHVTARPIGWRLRDFLSKRTTGWMNLRFGRGRRFLNAELIARTMMDDIRECRCDHVAFSGDATTMGFESEMAVAAQIIRFDMPGLAVPGNHDYYVRSAANSGYFERFFAPWQCGERIDDATYPFAQRVGHCWLIGVNSSRSNFLVWDARGDVGLNQAKRLRELLRRLSPGPRIIVTHYPLELADGTPEHRWRRVRDWKAIQQIAAEEGVSLWLHGHRHTRYVLRPSLPDRPFAVICAGSATQLNRWSYNIYSINGATLQMTRRTWSPTQQRFVAGDEEVTLSLEREPVAVGGATG